ncbi:MULTISPECIES: Crp/Fnr family transcriptional regulator [unclassified Pseudofrankia]|uniref:Crp/Fnr family transcriptional regulator n=1 Tax=unclassified Pseudofrankia TaxID=2994372 RepID=UPI0008D9769A|nr:MULTISPECIES: Crp/Fnr family transcriptional regulator [unclassified Pseudofrankia]MDT3440562.1 Crp/Fnr family transcriptional regulator [Pseudofrankia sp. BMG5.37]OHV47786.1 transcriptional regulator [Pseudofrankia sp. BMG5.36]
MVRPGSGEPPDNEAGRGEWLRRARWPEQTLLGRLPDRSRTELLELGGFREFASGMPIVREGDRTTFVAVLLRGWTKVTALTETGGVALLAVRHGGDVIGEFAGLDSQPRSATVTAVGSALAKVIRKEEFAGYLARDPVAAAAISRSIVAKTRFSIRRRVEFAGCPVAVRVARVLVELDRAYGIDRSQGGRALGVPLAQQELAALVGAHDPTVHKALRVLRRDKVIETGYRRVAILDMAALLTAAGLSST